MNLLITGAFPVTAAQTAEFEAAGWNVDIQHDERAQTVAPEKYDAVICNALFQYNDIEKFTSLSAVQLTSVGRDRIPEDIAAARGVAVYNAGDAYCRPMAEWAVFGILNIYKNARFLFENYGKWRKVRTVYELCGKRVCIFGFGNAGRETAKRLRGFDCRITAVDVREIDSPYADDFVPVSQSDRILPETDVLVIAMPLTRETEHYFGAERLGLLRDGAVIVNIARGALIDENALTEELRKGRFLGAALDVFETEPLPADSPLYTLPNVYVTPHNSFIGENDRERLNGIVRRNLLNTGERDI
ncbi:MAG: hydroxyacid dehydrogenase [Clostridia bacterium]|nr:hydroxyacid dehydrogenase [Clostridia bacterium]